MDPEILVPLLQLLASGDPVDVEELYTWCALDTLMFPALIQKVARVESTSPTSGRTIRLTADPSQAKEVEPAAAVVSLVSPDDMTSIRSSFFTRSTSSPPSRTRSHGSPRTQAPRCYQSPRPVSSVSC